MEDERLQKCAILGDSSTTALVTGTTETIPSSIASSKPPLTVTPTLEVSATATTVVLALLPTVTPSEPQANPATESTEQI